MIRWLKKYLIISALLCITVNGVCAETTALTTNYTPINSRLIPEGYRTSDISENHVTIPVARGQYTVSINDTFSDVPWEKRTYEETEYAGGIKTSYGYINTHHVYTDIFTYQYLPLPEEFQIDTAIMTDEEYLIQLEKAFLYLGSQYLDILNDVIILKDNQELTLEIAKAEGARLLEAIEQEMFQSAGTNFIKLMNARAVAGYFVPIDRNRVKMEYLAWQAGEQRWVLTDSFDLFGENSINGYGAIAMFDGALHLIETADYMNATHTLTRNSDELKQVMPQEKNDKPAEIIASSQKTAIVVTKSSPLSMRQSPNKNGKHILSIPKGEKVFVIEDGDWPYIEYNGKQGYADGAYLKMD